MNEERYVLKEPLSKDALAHFIKNYTEGLLERARISVPEEELTTTCNEGFACIPSLNADSYLTVLQEHKKASYNHIILYCLYRMNIFSIQSFLVLHYSSNCGACLAASHLVLAAKHYTSDIPNFEIVRIDVSRNTLSWHLDMEKVPSFVLYPAHG